jgi:SpoVK/Ycf46/Vps4 family AAA+-type ATPase
MTKIDFETHLSVSIVNRSEDDESPLIDSLLEGIAKGKTEIVNKTDILELRHPESMNNVGGMENLKEWINMRKRAYSQEAKDFGIDPPKGIVLVGIPGTGKSLASTAVAGELGIPLVRLDFGRVFNSLVGSSEQRVRDALRMCENMSPCVLHVDEIDKGLGGIGGSGDSGTSSRVLGTFLSWLQDNKKAVFTVVTANNIQGLPPELLRRGRFDDIFSTGFPSAQERREVLNIHLRKRGWSLDDYEASEIASVVNASRGYVPSEIEQAVKDALIAAFVDDEDLEMQHIVAELKAMVPMHVVHNEVIQVMAAWMRDNAKPASRSYEENVLSGVGSNVASIERKRKISPKSRVTTRRRRPDNDGDKS